MYGNTDCLSCLRQRKYRESGGYIKIYFFPELLMRLLRRGRSTETDDAGIVQ